MAQYTRQMSRKALLPACPPTAPRHPAPTSSCSRAPNLIWESGGLGREQCPRCPVFPYGQPITKPHASARMTSHVSSPPGFGKPLGNAIWEIWGSCPKPLAKISSKSHTDIPLPLPYTHTDHSSRFNEIQNAVTPSHSHLHYQLQGNTSLCEGSSQEYA